MVKKKSNVISLTQARYFKKNMNSNSDTTCDSYTRSSMGKNNK